MQRNRRGTRRATSFGAQRRHRQGRPGTARFWRDPSASAATLCSGNLGWTRHRRLRSENGDASSMRPDCPENWAGPLCVRVPETRERNRLGSIGTRPGDRAESPPTGGTVQERGTPSADDGAQPLGSMQGSRRDACRVRSPGSRTMRGCTSLGEVGADRRTGARAESRARGSLLEAHWTDRGPAGRARRTRRRATWVEPAGWSLPRRPETTNVDGIVGAEAWMLLVEEGRGEGRVAVPWDEWMGSRRVDGESCEERASVGREGVRSGGSAWWWCLVEAGAVRESERGACGCHPEVGRASGCKRWLRASGCRRPAAGARLREVPGSNSCWKRGGDPASGWVRDGRTASRAGRKCPLVGRTSVRGEVPDGAGVKWRAKAHEVVQKASARRQGVRTSTVRPSAGGARSNTHKPARLGVKPARH